MDGMSEIILDQVDPERLYKTVYDLQGIKHPVTSPAALNACADKIAETMRSIGLTVREQVFYIDGWDAPFRNIEGSIGDVTNLPAAVITAHYDTVATSWGANDDASGLAVMLETARLIAALSSPPPVYFVAVTLEESSNPVIFQPEYESLLELGICDREHFYTSWRKSQEVKRVWGAADDYYNRGGTYGEGLREGLSREPDLLPEVRSHFERILPIYADIDAVRSLGYKSRIGSRRWVEEAACEGKCEGAGAGKKIAFNITLDECGMFSCEPQSQGFFRNVDPFETAVEEYRLDAENRVGNFIMILSDTRSTDLARRFLAACRSVNVELPAARKELGMSFEECLHSKPAGLGSDHANFWAAGIPAILLYDTSFGRNPFVHMMADLSDELDYDKLAAVAKAVLTVLLDASLYQLPAPNPDTADAAEEVKL